MDEVIQVALPSDQNYIMGLLVTAVSLVAHLPPSAPVVINVLDGGIEERTFREFTECVLRYHTCTQFKRLRISETIFSDFPAWSGNKMTYARLMLPKLLPEVNYVIYSDTDFLWHIDASELWKKREVGIILQGVLDAPQTIEKERLWFSARGIDFSPNHYFGGGMMFMNLSLFRQERVVERVAEFLRVHPDVQFADQSATNAVLGARTKILESKWQTLSMFLTDAILKKGCAIHFPCESPWAKMKSRSDVLTDPKIMWHIVYAQIMGISLWESLRLRFSIFQIVIRRAMFLMGCSRMMRWLLYVPLWLLGYKGSVYKLMFWCRRLNYTDVLEGIDIHKAVFDGFKK